MAYCEKCGKETKDGQIYCESCLKEMEDSSFDDLFQSIVPGNGESDNSEDDFSKILEELQGPREEVNENVEKKEKTTSASTVSDVFSDAVSAISSLEDELEDTIDVHQTTEHKEEKKKGLFARLFRKKTKDLDESEENMTSEDLDKKALKKAKKEQKKQEKAELAQKKKEEAKKAKEEKLAAKASKSSKSESSEKDENDKKAKKADKKEAQKQKKENKQAAKKQRQKKEKKPKVVDEVVVEEDLGQFNIPVMVFVFAVFIIGIGAFLIRSSITSYDYSIQVASNKFERQEYDEAFQEIYGVTVKDQDTELYDKIMTVMYVNKQLNSYNNYMGLEMYPEALDSLIKGLKRYEKYIDAAKELGITDDLDYVRGQILEELKREFGLSEKKAMKLMKMKDKTEYSLKIYDIVLENTDYVNK